MNVILFVAEPPMFTTTGPVVAPAGTGAIMVSIPQLVGVAVTPLKVTVLVPCDVPNKKPLIATLVPTGPNAGESAEIDGETVNEKLLLA
jgi:hypothetical protein